MNPQIVPKPAFTLIGLKVRSNNANGEYAQIWDKFIPRELEISHPISPSASYGVMDNFDPNTREMDYIAGKGVSTVETIPHGMVRRDVPGGNYAMFPAKLTDNLGAIFHEIYAEWLPQSGYEHAGTPDFEYYDEHFKGGDSTLYICIPVRVKTS